MRLLLEDGFSIEKATGVGRYTQNLVRELGKYPEVEIVPQLVKESYRRGTLPNSWTYALVMKVNDKRSAWPGDTEDKGIMSQARVRAIP